METQTPKTEFEVVILFAGQKFKKKYFAKSRYIANIAALSDARKRIRVDHHIDNASEKMQAIESEMAFALEIMLDQKKLLSVMTSKLYLTAEKLNNAKDKHCFVLAKDSILSIIDFFQKTYEGVDTLEHYDKLHKNEK